MSLKVGSLIYVCHCLGERNDHGICFRFILLLLLIVSGRIQKFIFCTGEWPLELVVSIGKLLHTKDKPLDIFMSEDLTLPQNLAELNPKVRNLTLPGCRLAGTCPALSGTLIRTSLSFFYVVTFIGVIGYL